MHVELEDWKNGWFGVRIGVAPQEVDRLIELLNMIKNDHEQHFHISSEYKETGGIGDIEISIASENEDQNMKLSGRALGPGASI